MTALDFLLISTGSGAFLVCAAWAYKILSDTRARAKRSNVQEQAAHKLEEPLDPLGQQLHQFRNARFGRQMTPPAQREVPSTWPVMRPRAVPKKETDKGEK